LKRKSLAVGIVLFLIGSNFISTIAQDTKKSSSQTTRSNWLYVGGNGPGNYSKIQDAIDNASDGDTVFVFNGTYYGYVILNKSINLIGEDKNTTIIIGFFAYTISIVYDRVNMSGFTIQNGGRLGEGIRIDSSYNSFFNNIIDIPNDRIRISGSRNIIYDNTIKNTYMYLSGDSNIISGNIITNNYYGLYLIDSSDNIIYNNSFFNSGLFISFDIFRNNILTNNSVNGKPLVYVYDESNLVLDADVGQIILVNCTNITVKNQEIFNTFVGIQIWESNACIISDNIVAGNYYGIWLHGCNNTINASSIANNYCGISLLGDNNTISANTITNNSDNGIYLYYSDYNNIINNFFSNNYCSIQLDYGNDFNNIINNTITNNSNAIVAFSGNSNTNISDNTIKNNKEGITLVFGSYNNITQNIIANNDANGINICDSDYNSIINNNITDNDNGIYALRFDYNTIKGNNITWNNWFGINLNCSYGNIISGNNFLKNRQGIKLVSSNKNTILKNNFLKNKRHIFFENSSNIWNNNYWGRPRILPKLIFGIINIQNNKTSPIFDIDWYPAKKPNNIPEMD